MKKRTGINGIPRRATAGPLLLALLTVCLTACLLGCAQGVAPVAPNAPTAPAASPAPEPAAAFKTAPEEDGGGAGEPQSAVPIYRMEQLDPNVVNVLLIGTDSRVAHGTLMGGNADTIILASLNRGSGVVTLVSFLRDAYLPIGGPDGEWDRLKTAYRWGGTGMLINTLNSSFGLDIQSYIAIGLEGFAVFIDEVLDGLDVELDAAEMNEINARITEYENESALVKSCPPVTAAPGVVHLNGTQTLLFVRNRSTRVDGRAGEASEFDRAARQREVLLLMYEKFIAKEPVTAVPGVVRFALKHVETNMGLDEICRLAAPLMTEPVEIRTAEVPFSGTWEYGGGGGVVFERDVVRPQLHELLYPQ